MLAITFTNQAADELRERIAAARGSAPSVRVATFHGFGRSLLDE
ncbi:MAG: UvrD-helicase domain-containing protein, partial [Nitrospirota bacterium]